RVRFSLLAKSFSFSSSCTREPTTRATRSMIGKHDWRHGAPETLLKRLQSDHEDHLHQRGICADKVFENLLALFHLCFGNERLQGKESLLEQRNGASEIFPAIRVRTLDFDFPSDNGATIDLTHISSQSNPNHGST